MKYISAINLFVFEYLWISAVATICQPNSLFHVDCNSCICSEDGKTYSCDTQNCPRSNTYDDYYVEVNKEGRIILTPKPKPTKLFPIKSDVILDIPTLFKKNNFESDESSIENDNTRKIDMNRNQYFVKDNEINRALNKDFNFNIDNNRQKDAVNYDYKNGRFFNLIIPTGDKK